MSGQGEKKSTSYNLILMKVLQVQQLLIAAAAWKCAKHVDLTTKVAIWASNIAYHSKNVPVWHAFDVTWAEVSILLAAHFQLLPASKKRKKVFCKKMRRRLRRLAGWPQIFPAISGSAHKLKTHLLSSERQRYSTRPLLRLKILNP